MKNIILVAILACSSIICFGGFHCPDDITINCDMDVHNTDMTGYPNTTGFNVGHPIDYTDVNVTDGCGVGQVNRTWFQDLNNNQILDGDDPSCVQVITVAYLENSLFDINWPPNRDLSCIADVAFEPPVIVHGPCDLVGYIWEDQVFELTNDACYKVLRTFEVINWCIYDENNPNGDGRYTHTQVIKVTEKELPEFTECQDITIAMDEGCQANVTIASAAMDTGDCPSEELYWTVEIDLGWDLIVDYEYSYLLTGEFYLAPTANGEEINITLPDLVDGGTHGAFYTVKDGCGNVKSCQQRIYVEDQKSPTPYCHSFVTAAFDADAMPAMVPAQLFNIGATDNCTATEDIQISFSADTEDTIKVIDCGSQGFQFFNIFATDEAGNADFCQVFMLIFDNDGCSFRYAPMGTIHDVRGGAVEGVNVYLTDGADAMYETASAELGYFQFGHTELISDYYLMTDVSAETSIEPTILDLKRMQDYLIGNRTLDAKYQYVAADVNRDKSFNAFDALALKNHLLGYEALDNDAFSVYIEAESIEDSWKDYKSEVSYMDYDGSFDLLHVTLKDLVLESEEGKQSLSIDHQWIDNATVISLKSTEEISSEGLEVYLQMPLGLSEEQVSISSEILDLKANEQYYNPNTGEYRIVALKSFTISENLEWLQIKVDSDIEKLATVQVNWVSNDALVRSEIQSENTIKDVADLSANEGILVSNVVTDQLLLKENIQLGTLNIYDMYGSLVYTAISPDASIDVVDLAQGIYIIKWSNQREEREERFVKN